MRKISLFFILSMLAVGIHAQELTERELQAKEDSIFNLKFSEEAHYAEVVVEMLTDNNETVSLAQQQSINLLQSHVIEIFAKRLNMSKQDVQEIWDVIDDKCQNIEIRRGDLYKICKYIAKDALKGWLGSKKVKPLTPEDSLILFGPKEEKKIIPEKQDTTEVVDKVSVEPGIVISDTIIKPIPPTPPTPEKDVVIPEFCKKMISKENKKALEEFLEDGALYNELMYGTLDDMQYMSKCYVVVIEKATEKIKAVLDKGESARVNFMTKAMDYYGSYDKDKYELIFVQEL